VVNRHVDQYELFVLIANLLYAMRFAIQLAIVGKTDRSTQRVSVKYRRDPVLGDACRPCQHGDSEDRPCHKRVCSLAGSHPRRRAYFGGLGFSGQFCARQSLIATRGILSPPSSSHRFALVSRSPLHNIGQCLRAVRLLVDAVDI